MLTMPAPTLALAKVLAVKCTVGAKSCYAGCGADKCHLTFRARCRAGVGLSPSC